MANVCFLDVPVGDWVLELDDEPSDELELELGLTVEVEVELLIEL